MTSYQKQLQRLWMAACLVMTPPPQLIVSAWADKYAVLSAESSTETGQWTSEPYQRGIMDALDEPETERVSVMKSARVGYTKCLNHIIGKHIDVDPCSLLVVQPTVEDAEGYSKDEIAPMLRDTPALQGKVSAKARDGSNTLLKKQYPGGVLHLVGANSARGFRRITVRGVLFDEVDAYPSNAGGEGDPIKLGEKRCATDPNAFIYMGSTPTLDGFSRIQKAFNKSDQRYYFVPCPHCKKKQTLKWGGKGKPYGIKWEPGKPQTAYYECEHCHEAIDPSHRAWMVENGEWRSTAPFECCGVEQEPEKWDGHHALCRVCGERVERHGHAGFHIWAAYSPFPKARWPALAAEFLEVKDDPEQLITFVNTVKGETWKEAAAELDWEPLHARRENYGPKVPMNAVVLTAGVDVQPDRLELQVIAWGPNNHCWPLRYQVFDGDPSDSAVWEKLSKALDRQYEHESGHAMWVEACCIDTGGHNTHDVYAYVKERESEGRVFAIKGGKDPTGPPVRRPSRDNLGNVDLYTLGSNTIKTRIARRLKITESDKPGFIHFPQSDEFEVDYFQQLTAEKGMKVIYNGHPVIWFRKPHSGIRNEALDTFVYAMAALFILNPDMEALPQSYAERVDPQQQEQAQPQRVSSNWMNS
ncbi:phage terminase large subunit family protein [Microbulbifer sp. PSTR4-B]|uniref:phage terminase large subunit family protein n=1 Tax=unclassified Microbulbifer TaxID=2619833 RepID=UPI00403AB013